MISTIVILRHAQWDFHEDHLTTEGRRDAKRLAPTLGGFALAFCSPAGRARETVEALGIHEFQVDPRVATGFPPHFHPRLRALRDEVTAREEHPNHGFMNRLFADLEIFAFLKEKGRDFVEVLYALANKAKGKRVLIVTHETALTAALYLVRQTPWTAEACKDYIFAELEGVELWVDIEIGAVTRIETIRHQEGRCITRITLRSFLPLLSPHQF